jgi:hypothetical protein
MDRRRDGRRDGRRDRYLYIIDCLWQVVAFDPKEIDATTAQSKVINASTAQS